MPERPLRGDGHAKGGAGLLPSVALSEGRIVQPQKSEPPFMT
jgi:hypothetical protein